ncbi:conjugal transfer protein TraB [Mesorhizobium sp. BHbdii]
MSFAVALIAGAAVVGAVAWSGQVLTLPVACLYPALWAWSPSRAVSALVAMAYFLAASRDLPIGVSIFYETDMWLGIGPWLSASLLFVFVHTMFWSSSPGLRRALRYAVAWILMSVPPFGIIGWASPITAAGVLFRGWGWMGLGVTALGLSVMTTRAWLVPTLVFGLAFAVSAATWTPPRAPDGWVGIDTNFHYENRDQYADYEQQLATLSLVRQAAPSGVSTIVLTESAFGIWTPTTERFWAEGLQGVDAIVLGGAIVINEAGYDNVVVEVSGEGTRIVYRQRMPVPVSMWQPWARAGARAHFFEGPIAEVAGTRIAPLICHEQLFVWPVVEAMVFEHDAVVAIGNGWWTGDSSIVAIQKASAEAWALLFGTRVSSAFNRQ